MKCSASRITHYTVYVVVVSMVGHVLTMHYICTERLTRQEVERKQEAVAKGGGQVAAAAQ